MVTKSRREEAVEFLKANPGEDITTNEVAEALEVTREQAAQTLHGLIRHGLGGQLHRTGQSTWIYQPPVTMSLRTDGELTTTVPVGFRAHIQISAKIGNWYIAAVVDPSDDYRDRGMRLWVQPVNGTIEFEPPAGAQYDLQTPIP